MTIRAPYDRREVLAKLAPHFAETGSIVLPNAFDGAVQARFRPFFAADRGRYERAGLEPLDELQRLAEGLCSAPLQHLRTEARLLRPGCYALTLDDEKTRFPECVEVTVDVSQRSGGPACEYRSARRRVVVPQVPGVVAVVLRTADLWRCDRYLPVTAGRQSVLRLRAAYAFV